MRYNQVKDLVHWAAAYHGRMAEQFSEAASQADSERLEMVLTHIASRELRMKSGLEALFHDEQAHAEVLELWFDDPTDFPQPPLLEALAESSPAASIDDATATVTESHQQLRALYEHRAECANIEPEEAFFTSLAQGHEAEVRQLMTSLQEFEDV